MRGVQQKTQLNDGGFMDQRKKCTKDNHYTPKRHAKDPEAKWMHDAVRQIGEEEDGWPCGDIARMRCDNCGVEWNEELPQ